MSNKSDSGSEDAPAVSNGSGGSGPGSQGRASSMDTYDDDVCRDYMRNVCTRGKRCRYRHPPSEDRSEQPVAPRRDLTFCHDYQNNGCTRPSCKFLHCSRDEQEYFHRTGLLPSRLNSPGAGAVFAVAGPQRAEVPVCRDYLNGDCKRGSKCKYRHEAEKPSGHYSSSSSSNSRHHQDYDRRGHGDYGSGSDSKRRRMDDDYGGDGDAGDMNGGRPRYSALEEENAALRRKMAELKKQVSDLTAINEVLLEQNARYRMGKAAAAAAAVVAGGGVGSIQVSTVSQQGIMPPTVALAPTVNAAHSSLTQQLNSSLTQQVALNSDLATQHAIAAQRMAVLAPPRAAPSAMSVTPTVTIGQQNVAGPLALTQSNLAVSMASMPQLQVAHSLTQNLGAPSTSLVSYPIMSQNMRSAVEPSSHTH